MFQIDSCSLMAKKMSVYQTFTHRDKYIVETNRMFLGNAGEVYIKLIKSHCWSSTCVLEEREEMSYLWCCRIQKRRGRYRKNQERKDGNNLAYIVEHLSTKSGMHRFFLIWIPIPAFFCKTVLHLQHSLNV